MTLHHAYLVTKCLRGIIYNDCLGKVSPQYPQFLDVVPSYAHTVLPEETMADKPARLIEQIQQLVGIHLGGGREENDLEGL